MLYKNGGERSRTPRHMAGLLRCTGRVITVILYGPDSGYGKPSAASHC